MDGFDGWLLDELNKAIEIKRRVVHKVPQTSPIWAMCMDDLIVRFTSSLDRLKFSQAVLAQSPITSVREGSISVVLVMHSKVGPN